MKPGKKSVRKFFPEKAIKQFFIFLFLLFLLLPGIRKQVAFSKESPLKGAFTLTTSAPLTPANWFSGWFQYVYITSFNDVIGLRPTLIRLYNQVNFSLFNLSSSGNVVVGKSGYLYSEDYIKAYIGKDKLSRKDLKKKTGYIYEVQKILENEGVHFLLVFAPSKARIFPDYIPSRYFSPRKHLSNYEEYSQIIHQYYPHLHVLDVDSYFMKLRKSSAIPLYPKGGTHWSNYALYKIFMDTLIKRMASMQKTRPPVLTERNFHWSDKPVSPDDDLVQLQNLFKTSRKELLPYADFNLKMDRTYKKPSFLMISDSYFSILYSSDIFKKSISRCDFWYYNKTRYPVEFYKGNTDPSFLRDDLLKHDFVILMATETNIDQMFYFPETVLSWFGLEDSDIKSKEAKREKRIQYYISAIKKNPGWLNSIKSQMAKEHKPLEELIRDNAEYMEKKEHFAKSR